MEKSGIVQIQESANVPALIEQLTNTKTVHPLVLTPNSMDMSSLERHMEFASRYRMNISTTSINDFIDYNKQFDEVGATCFINADSMTSKTIFDLGTVEAPGHKEHTAALDLKRTAVYRALLGTSGDKLTQKEAAEFLEDWADFITVEDQHGESMTFKAAAASLQDMTIASAKTMNSTVSDFGESNNSMESIEAKSKGALPAWVDFKCIPHLGLEARTFTLRVSILTSGDRPSVVLRIVKLENIQEEIALEFKDKLVESFTNNHIDTYLGKA